MSWAQLGADQTNLNATFTVNSALGKTVSVTLSGGNSVVSVVCTATPCSWTGSGFTAGDSMLWTSDAINGGNGPVALSFTSGISGGGALLQANIPGTFTAKIEGFNGAASLGSFTLPSNGSGDALYIGLKDLTGANITKLVFSLTVCGSDDVSGCTDFGIDTVGLNVPAVVGPTTTTLNSNANPSVFGQQVTFTATVASGAAGTPTGTVTFFDGTTNIGMGTLSGGVATLATSSLAVGSHSISAVYAGDSNFQGSTSNTVAQVVNKASANQVLSSSANPSVFGQSVMFTATLTAVAPGAGTPTGTETFSDGATTLGTPTLNGGAASVSSNALSVGPHAIAATYGGDSNFQGTAGTLPQTVNKAATTTLLGSAANPAVFGQTITFTATVTAVAPGAGTPSGTVMFMDGVTSLGSAPLSGGVATLMDAALAVGSHSITASYNGDTDFTSSTSVALPQTVNKDAATVSAGAAPNPSVFGQAVMFSATVTANAPGTGTPTGTVQFNDNGSPIGSVGLSGGTANFPAPPLSVGTHSITVSYVGDGDFNISTSSPISQVVNKAGTTTILGSSLNPSTNGQAVTFMATVTVNAPGAGTPQGTVNFDDGATFLGSGTLSAGTATFMTSSLTIGTHPITAIYVGDVDFGTSTSNTVQQVVNPTGGSNADLGVTVSHPFTHPAAVGGTFTETITVTNHGPDATDATLVISLTGNVVLGAVSGTGCTVGGTISCNLGTLNNGDQSIVTIPITPLLGRTVSIQVMVNGTLPDNFPGNNNAGEVIQSRHKPLAIR